MLPMSHVSHLILAAAVALIIAGCSDGPPVLRGSRSNNVSAIRAGGEGSDSECADLRAQIRANMEDRREAPTTSTSPVIVQAAQGKADQRIDDLQQRLDELDCPAEVRNDPGTRPPPPLQPAPGGPSTP